ncbi:MAG: hypothetical protein HRU07_05765 [Nitrosopumilus sp.]|nr:hypothetical protein [Nitrosopumilus sp.]NRA05653.1 hypothetical protein [Nitrosopumilus sp.]
MNITNETRIKIRKISLFDFRLSENNIRYNTLKKLFFNDTLDLDKKSILFLQDRSLIDENNSPTPFGLALIISHEFQITLQSILLLSRIYNYQKIAGPESIFPRPTLTKDFGNLANGEAVRRNITSLKSDGIIAHLGTKQLRITVIYFEKLSKYDKELLKINSFLYELNEAIEELISQDPLVQQNRSKNSALFESIGKK